MIEHEPHAPARFQVLVHDEPDVEIEANLVWTAWSQFQNLDLTVPASGGGQMTIAQPRNYEDKFTFRVGAEYRMPEYKAAIRAGYIYDPTPIKPQYETVDLPDINRHDVCVGGSYSITPDYDVHLGLLYVLPGNRKTADDPYMPIYKRSFDVSAFVASVTLAGTFGRTGHTVSPPPSAEPDQH